MCFVDSRNYLQFVSDRLGDTETRCPCPTLLLVYLFLSGARTSGTAEMAIKAESNSQSRPKINFSIFCFNTSTSSGAIGPRAKPKESKTNLNKNQSGIIRCQCAYERQTLNDFHFYGDLHPCFRFRLTWLETIEVGGAPDQPQPCGSRG